MRTALVAVFAAAGLAAGASAQPETPKKPVTDEYHGIKVTDDYRWLEDWSNPEVRAWSEAQNAYARAILDALPNVQAIRERITALRASGDPEYSALKYKGGLLFAIKNQPPKQQPMLVVLSSPDDLSTERVVVDPNALDPEGRTSIDFFEPSHDGKLVAVSVSEGGSESGTVYVFEVETGRKLEDVVPRVNGGTAGGSLAWNADNTGFFYTRYPRPGERPPEDLFFYQQVYFHKLGTPTESDTYEIGRDFPRIAEIELDTDDGRYITAAVENGDGGEFRHYVRMPDGVWRLAADYDHRVFRTRFGKMEILYLLTYLKAPRGQLIQIPLFDPSMLNLERVIPQSEFTMVDLVSTGDFLFMKEVVGGPSQLRIFDFRGGESGFVPILPNSTVTEMVPIGAEDILYRNESMISPPAWYRVNAVDVSPVRTPLSRKSAADFSDCEVVRETATSKDGTRVPITILRRKGTRLDGSNPTILYGYGGYGRATQPTFNEARRVWLEQGGVYAIAHIRGGGEFGEAWHLAGNLTKKQNVFDDFYACMERLKELGYCTAERLAIMGGSNGGLLMGAMITQHPEACRAVVSAVGVYDMLRVEVHPNGEFNTTEFGTVKDKAQFEALYAYSPYHRVPDGARFPAVLMMTGANDPRVDPLQSRKMIARLQAAQPNGRFLLRTSMTSGHGAGTNLSGRIEQDVDRYAFLFHELGVTYQPAK